MLEIHPVAQQGQCTKSHEIWPLCCKWFINCQDVTEQDTSIDGYRFLVLITILTKKESKFSENKRIFEIFNNCPFWQVPKLNFFCMATINFKKKLMFLSLFFDNLKMQKCEVLCYFCLVILPFSCLKTSLLFLFLFCSKLS